MPHHAHHYKLTYFDVRGVAEATRMIFHYAGVKFDDVRVAHEQWPALKPKTPYGKLPVLTITKDDGGTVELAESYAIARYLAHHFNLAGKDDIEAAQLDAFADAHKDLVAEMGDFFAVVMGRKAGDKERVRKEVFLPALEHRDELVERALAKSGGGFLGHSGVSWVDFVVASFTKTALTFAPEEVKRHPEVLKHMERVHALPQLKQYISARKETQI
jgi:glutathione S-transferase